MEREFNKYQTPITDELLEKLPQEVVDQFIDFINNISFINNLISPNRQHAKDRPRDEKGRIIIDLANPHILEDMDYFRPSALYYKEHKCYTKLKPNSNPNSEYYKWLKEEVRRCHEGYVRESDGEWVTGFLYFYLNYTPIILSRIRKGTKQADRVEDFPEMWEGVYWRFHYIEQAQYGGLYNNFLGGNQGAELARRGASKSYSLGSMTSKIFLLGKGFGDRSKNNRVVVTASKKEFLTKDGTLNKFNSTIDFCAINTQFPNKRLNSSLNEMVWKLGYKDLVTGAEMGLLNSVYGVTSKDDESKVRGKRSDIFVDEFGTFARLIDAYNVWTPSVQEGDYVFNLIYLCGTAGDSESDFAGASELMYNPSGYNLYSLPNVYDKPNQGRKDFVFFFAGYVNRKGCMDKDGNSDVTKALIEILLNRYKVKYNSSDPNTVLRTIAEIPITPSEAIIKAGVNMFPVTDLTERLNQLDSSNELNDIYVGNLVIDSNNEVVFRPSTDKPIREFPHKDNKQLGAIEIITMPEKDSSGKVFSNRYIAGLDPYDDDSSDTMSLGSLFILDLWNDKIVAEYTGRPLANEFYETARRMLLFYNAKLNYENNKKGLFAYFSQMHSLSLLTDTLDFLKDKQIIKGNFIGNKVKGTNASLPINNYAKDLLKKWLMQPHKVVELVDGKEVETTIMNLYTIRNRALLKELILYNNEGNFDRVSAMGMLMLLREDIMIKYSGKPSDAKENYKDINYLGNDDFFSKNYNRH